jgi:hypothetical protein
LPNCRTAPKSIPDQKAFDQDPKYRDQVVNGLISTRGRLHDWDAISESGDLGGD